MVKSALLASALFLFPAKWPANAPESKEYLFAALVVNAQPRQSFHFFNHSKTRYYFVTPQHLLDGVKSLPDFMVLAQDGKRDLLLFSATLPTRFQRASFVLWDPKAGDCVRTFSAQKSVKGKILRQSDELFVHNAPIQVGFSGYPLLDCADPNHVLGVNTRINDDKTASALSASALLDFVRNSTANLSREPWLDLRLWASLW